MNSSTLSSQEIPRATVDQTPLPLSPFLSPPYQGKPSTEMAVAGPLEWTPLRLLPLRSSQDQPTPSTNTNEMALPPSKNKPSINIPIPTRAYTSTEQLNTPLSTSSSDTSHTWAASTPNSPNQTPFTSGQITLVSDSFSLALDSYSSGPKPVHQYRLRQVDKNGQPLGALERTYYKPIDEVNIAEALNARPLPGTFRYSLERERDINSEVRCLRRREQTSEQKKAEFERVKRSLRGS